MCTPGAISTVRPTPRSTAVHQFPHQLFISEASWASHWSLGGSLLEHLDEWFQACSRSIFQGQPDARLSSEGTSVIMLRAETVSPRCDTTDNEGTRAMRPGHKALPSLPCAL
jgi:hypothetical protein